MQVIKVRSSGSASYLLLGLRVFLRCLLLALLACLLYAFLNNIRLTLKYRGRRKFTAQFKNFAQDYWLAEQHTEACLNDTKLFILILSRRETHVNRQAIRETWYNDKVNGTVLRFFLSDANPNKHNPGDLQQSDQMEEINKFVLEEQKYYGDIVFLEGIQDTYANLHLMMHAAFQWQQTFCPQAKYVLKTDDDTVVHLERLNWWMDKKFTPELEQKNAATCFGCPVLRSKPIRLPYHRWYVPEELYPNKTYPNYIQGCTYLCSGLAIQRILTKCQEVNAMNMEDVLYTGIVAEKANVSRSDQRWHFFWGGPYFNQTTYCIDGMPYITAVFGRLYTLELFQYVYQRLSSLNCI